MKVFVKIPIICWKIDNNFFNFVSNNIKFFLVYVSNRFYSKNKNESINIQANQKKVTFTISNIDDLIAFYEIFVLETYKARDSVKNIIDLGANIGVASLYFALRYPNAKIFACEPNPEVFSVLSKNLSSFENVKTYPFLLSDETNEQKTFFVSSNRSHSSSVLNRGEEFESCSVRSFKLVDLLEFLKLKKVDFLKFDIEGSEFDLFKELNELNINQFIGEVHMDLAPEGTNLESFNLKNNYNIHTSGTGRRFNIYGANTN